MRNFSWNGRPPRGLASIVAMTCALASLGCRELPDEAEPADAGADRATGGTGACIDTFGDTLTTGFGRLDGTLVAVVPLFGPRACRGDDDHVHLQVRSDGEVYDVSVNVGRAGNPVYLGYFEGSLPGRAWSEGWHTDVALDYPSLGVESTGFAGRSPSELDLALRDLPVGAEVSIFMTAWGPDGGHKVHRNGAWDDGAIAIRPRGGPTRMVLLRFAGQVF